MSKFRELPFETTQVVRDCCLCLHAQRAARALALNRPAPPTIGSVADLLAMDRTTLTAALKILERRNLVRITVDKEDRRSRRLAITSAGRILLDKAFPVWKETHAQAEKEIAGFSADRLRQALDALS